MYRNIGRRRVEQELGSITIHYKIIYILSPECEKRPGAEAGGGGELHRSKVLLKYIPKSSIYSLQVVRNIQEKGQEPGKLRGQGRSWTVPDTITIHS